MNPRYTLTDTKIISHGHVAYEIAIAPRDVLLAFAKWNDANGDFDGMEDADLRAMIRDWARDVYGEH